MDKINLNIVFQVKRENEKYMTVEEINNYMDSTIPDSN